MMMAIEFCQCVLGFRPTKGRADICVNCGNPAASPAPATSNTVQRIAEGQPPVQKPAALAAEGKPAGPSLPRRLSEPQLQQLREAAKRVRAPFPVGTLEVVGDDQCSCGDPLRLHYLDVTGHVRCVAIKVLGRPGGGEATIERCNCYDYGDQIP